ncbi:PREDICTED: cytochrome c oxidase subunit 6B2 [Bison bison bison]|uniref:Cytochrome c oxidase subunit 6B2 n=1 Tax=Bison bison bison TaxID=43346 RepID=A0A6P3HWP0_BISBB|nr:PREDICTED: cytochrome c oxidase subunit 6B2 [Bison bison bison]
MQRTRLQPPGAVHLYYYHRCIKTMNRRGKSTQPCEYYFRVYHSLCPISWVQRWKEQIKDGTFAGKI